MCGKDRVKRMGLYRIVTKSGIEFILPLGVEIFGKGKRLKHCTVELIRELAPEEYEEVFQAEADTFEEWEKTLPDECGGG